MSQFFHRIKQGFFMAGTSIRLVLQNPEILWFPLLNIGLLISFAVLALIVVMTFFQWDLESVRLLVKSYQQTYTEISLGAFTLVAGYVFFVISYFTNVALINYSASHLNGQSVSIGHSLRIGLQRWTQILIWSLVEICIVVPLALMSTPEGNLYFFVGSIIASILSLTYTLATFFVPAFIAEEPQSLWTTVTNSVQLMKQRIWEVIGFSLGFLIINMLLMVTVSILLVGLGALIGFTLDRLLQVHGMGIAFLITSAIMIQLFRTLIATAYDVFKAALYNDIRNKKSGPFAQQLICENTMNNH